MTARRMQGAGGAHSPVRANPGDVGQRAALQDAHAVLEALRTSKSRKYKNTPITVDGVRFDSKKEAARYAELRMMEQAGVICDLMVHEAFPLVIHGVDCGAYISDFSYLTETGERVVEDVKSPTTRKLPTYRLKARMLWALYGLRVREI